MTGRVNARKDFWARVAWGAPGVCWPFGQLAGTAQYGVFTFQGKKWKAHRLALYFAQGRLDGQALHTCDNPPCCNPFHLYDGTHQENMRDVRERRRHEGKRNGSRNPAAKLTDERVAEIRQLLGKIPQRELARRYGVSQTAIALINRNQTWKV